MNKRAQSQIITTVLIILLVLAAIVIVWQVVQNLIVNTTDDYDVKTECLGSTISIANVVMPKGTCSVEDNGNGGCPVTGDFSDKTETECDTIVATHADCQYVAGKEFTETTGGVVTIQRNSGGTTLTSEKVGYILLHKGQNIASEISGLGAVESRQITIAGLAPSDTLEASLTINEYACGGGQIMTASDFM